MIIFLGLIVRIFFLISDNCPNCLKADVEKAKQNVNVDNLDDPVENQFENEMFQQPDWMELIQIMKKLTSPISNMITMVQIMTGV
jgi:hypothetical protein